MKFFHVYEGRHQAVLVLWGVTLYPGFMKEPDPILQQHPILVGAHKCLEILFPDESSRPGIRTFREWQARRYFPEFKIGRRTFVNPVEVHAALARRCRIQATPAP